MDSDINTKKITNMILQNMTDKEKFNEAFRVVDKTKNLFDNVLEDVTDKFRRGNRFPYFIRYAFEDHGNNWRLVFMCRSKEQKKKKAFFSFCYTTYNIEKSPKDMSPKELKHGKDINCGKGVLWFDPNGLWHYLHGSSGNHGLGCVVDITPHAFNRYTERYLKPKGLQLEFDQKVESIMNRWRWCDIIGDKSSQKYTKNVLSSYDIFMQGGGMLRGQILNMTSMRFFTYVSEDMYYSNQLERQEETLREYQKVKHRKVNV